MASVSPRHMPAFVKPPKFEEYSEKYKEHIIMERRDGVIMLRMHTKNKTLVWGPQLHRAIHQAVEEAAADPENQVMILTATGDFWVAYGYSIREEGYNLPESTAEERAKSSMDFFVGDGMPLQEALVFDVRIPTIAAINGPGYHMEMALMCDLTICTDDTVMVDVHKWMGFVSGDGVNIAYQGLMGNKRANYAMLLGTPVTAQQALEWGMVNEVVPRQRIYDRAWELGAKVMEGGEKRRAYRRMMTEIMRKPWKTRMSEDFFGAFAAEMYGYMAEPDVSHDDEALDEMWKQCGVEIPEW
ncbi:enoyl-CoA hydratase/isomerase family protein [Actinomadura sp. LD22]|uniref:Enoyl-CoA hydratase/isomerase family protein n=1 Tax=Actinomadura physcomitrii TaxID=2650748 RepID=A0A6I4MEG7_9ACTN|nr:enoyl-CoA hydratase/isomerase family protein [Actinomadura physcomitrii]MWA03270.1 enoyl-CoA hydratase/isomerase family protein [Actinomadura physcomitrii]